MGVYLASLYPDGFVNDELKHRTRTFRRDYVLFLMNRGWKTLGKLFINGRLDAPIKVSVSRSGLSRKVCYFRY